MSDTPVNPQYSWICPECTRRVPNRFETCRCGCARDAGAMGAMGAEGAEGAEGTVWGPPPPTPSKLPWIILGVVALAAAGTLIALQVMPVKSAPSSALESPIATEGKPDAPNGSAVVPTESAELRRDKPNAPNAAIEFEPYAPLAPAPIARAAPIAPGAPGNLEDVISRAIPAIVSIETGQGRGSGFFVAPRTVITNRHVIQDNVSVTVRLSTGQTLPGRVETSSTEYDLAIVRVDSAMPSQPILPLGTVNDVRPGQEVIAIGLALGVFQNSVTRGIISAVRRADRTVMLQTDAAINPGNSGGPLLNRQGLVVGINTLKVGGPAESLGFAVAADHATALLSGGRSAQPKFGATAQQNQQLAPAFGARSSTDIAREQGTKRYGQIVEAVSRQAVQLDAYWNRIKANCTVRVAPGYDREWFGLWDGRAKLDSPDASCGAAVEELQEMAGQLRTAMGTAQEEARRSSVLPGELRDIRRRYRMDWPGFER
jgi:S1-C subfamily serine protease